MCAWSFCTGSVTSIKFLFYVYLCICKILHLCKLYKHIWPLICIFSPEFCLKYPENETEWIVMYWSVTRVYHYTAITEWKYLTGVWREEKVYMWNAYWSTPLLSIIPNTKYASQQDINWTKQWTVNFSVFQFSCTVIMPLLALAE